MSIFILPLMVAGFESQIRRHTVGLSKEEIVDLALRYIPANEIADFPYDGDLFCLLMRQLPTDKVLAEEEGWAFSGYAICTGYTCDEDARPRGKWLWLHFASLASFPPVAQVLKLQPPHVVKGRFQSVDRAQEIRIVKVTFNAATPDLPEKGKPGTPEQSPQKKTLSGSKKAKNVIAFRTKSTS